MNDRESFAGGIEQLEEQDEIEWEAGQENIPPAPKNGLEWPDNSH